MRSIPSLSLVRVRRLFSTSRLSLGGAPPLVRPGPPPLPPKEQREFEELQKQAARPAANISSQTPSIDPNDDVHPDLRSTPAPEFVGDVNPVTGERGGPKREPVKHNDWSHSGRVTDF